MFAFGRRFPPAIALVLIACGGTTVQWTPSLVTHVPDGTSVRFAVGAGKSFVSGTAVGWDRGAPRLRTAGGDTLAVPRGARVEVHLARSSHDPKFGAVVGGVAGVLAGLADCGRVAHCGEQEFRPMLGVLVGGLIGYVLTTTHWSPLTWPTLEQDSLPPN